MIHTAPYLPNHVPGSDVFDDFSRAQKSHLANFGRYVPLYTTDVSELGTTFLLNLPPEERQHHNCRCCLDFIHNYGGLVTVTDTGKLVSVMWPHEVPELYERAASACRTAVESAHVNSVFKSESFDLGRAEHGGWTHMHVTAPPTARKSNPLLTASQEAAERRADFWMLSRALSDYTAHHIETAVTLLEADALYRGEKTLGVAKWFRDLKYAVAKYRSRRDNLVWRAVATAPPGFAHVRSSMIGTLLDDIKDGLPTEAVAKKFAEKMNPLQYQRPTAPPAAGNIAAAEKAFAELGLGAALKRRYATLDDIVAIWRPQRAEKPTGEGLFGHLTPKGQKGPAPTSLPETTMTWVKFRDTVLPNALEIEANVGSTMNGIALVTAADMEAPPLFQWDSLEQRNPVSWYVYSVARMAARWNVVPGWVPVEALTLLPPHWYTPERFTHHGEGVIAVLKGARDTDNTGGAGIFPECLKAELHGVRATVEAYSQGASIETPGQPAAGIDFRKSAKSTWGTRLRVRTATSVGVYKLDRWD